jgi:hypothetical protein
MNHYTSFGFSRAFQVREIGNSCFACFGGPVLLWGVAPFSRRDEEAEGIFFLSTFGLGIRSEFQVKGILKEG